MDDLYQELVHKPDFKSARETIAEIVRQLEDPLQYTGGFTVTDYEAVKPLVDADIDRARESGAFGNVVAPDLFKERPDDWILVKCECCHRQERFDGSTLDASLDALTAAGWRIGIQRDKEVPLGGRMAAWCPEHHWDWAKATGEWEGR